MAEHGAMPAARLYESPFTDIHAQGPGGVFDGNKVEQLFQALQGLQAGGVSIHPRTTTAHTALTNVPHEVLSSSA